MTKVHTSYPDVQGKVLLKRDRLTWLSYGMLAYYAYLQASLGSILPFIRSDLHLDYSLTAWHFSIFGAGMLLAGLTASQLVRRLGRASVFWGGAVGMALGCLLITLDFHPWMTLAGTLVMGLFGTLLLICIQSVLADRHGEHQGIALAEANFVASMGAGLSALFVGVFARIVLGWRGALVISILALVALYIYGGRELLDSKQSMRVSGVSRQEKRQALPLIFWINWLAALLIVSAEWSMNFWAASFLQTRLHIDAGSAATLLALYLLATICGRFLGSRLMRIMTGTLLLICSLVIAIFGFIFFWQAGTPLLVILGLLVTGLSLSNLWPQTLALALETAPRQSDQASASISFAAGLAITIAPLVLGTFANATSLATAYTIVPCLLIGALVVRLYLIKRS